MSEFRSVAPESSPARPDTVDTTSPSAARAYDYYLGGGHHFAVDREFARSVLEQVPFVSDFARDNRAFLRRAVEWLTEQGVDQFLDIGSGIPTVGNVHEIAGQADPAARTVYVDYEHVAVAHSELILDEADPQRQRTTVVQADLRAPEEILNSPEVCRVLDFGRPIAVLIVATMHFIGPGDKPQQLVARYRDALAPGSYLVLSHLTLDGVPEAMVEQGRELERLYGRTANPGYFRDRDEFTALLSGLDPVEPGVVWAPQWHPDSHDDRALDPASTATLVGVGHKSQATTDGEVPSPVVE